VVYGFPILIGLSWSHDRISLGVYVDTFCAGWTLTPFHKLLYSGNFLQFGSLANHEKLPKEIQRVSLCYSHTASTSNVSIGMNVASHHVFSYPKIMCFTTSATESRSSAWPLPNKKRLLSFSLLYWFLHSRRGSTGSVWEFILAHLSCLLELTLKQPSAENVLLRVPISRCRIQLEDCLV